MAPVSTTSAENATKIRYKISWSRQETASKVVAFKVLTSLKKIKISGRRATALLEVSNSTMQSWSAKKNPQKACPELAAFLATPAGQGFLQRTVMAAYQAIHYGQGGLRSLEEFLQLSPLNEFVASSVGALQRFSVRCEEYIVGFADREEKRLAENMKRKKITAGLDEMFRGRQPCLVAIEVVSNYILLEKFTDDRKAETWSKELKPRLEELNVELGQVVSDLCGAIRSATEQMGAKHVSELFHGLYEISKATSGGLAAQEREFEKKLGKAEKKLEKAIEKHGENSAESKQAQETRNLRSLGYEARKERCKKVKTAKQELGKIHHPINLQTGKLQTADDVKARFNEELTTIERSAKEAGLSQSCRERLAKARRAFDLMIEYVTYFFIWHRAFVGALELEPKQERFFNEVVFPLSYLNKIWRQLPKKRRAELQPLKNQLENDLKNAAYSEKEKIAWMEKGRECAEKFQRSSSCVEGRNGMLSLFHHRFHRLSARSIKALTAVHNFHVKRSDDTTAAERFFGCQHANMFDSLVENVRIPGPPRQQHHDQEKRLNGREKRRAA